MVILESNRPEALAHGERLETCFANGSFDFFWLCRGCEVQIRMWDLHDFVSY